MDDTCEWHLCDRPAKIGRTRRFCGTKCKNKFYVDRRRRKLKQKAVNYLGGICQICGYGDEDIHSLWALQFHHVNPEDKEFTIASSTRSWEAIREELDKCMLVCSNCHAEIHHEEHLLNRE